MVDASTSPARQEPGRYRERQSLGPWRRVVRHGDSEVLRDRSVRRDGDGGGATDRPAGGGPNRELGPRNPVVAVVDQTCGDRRRGAGIDRGRSVERGVSRADRANDGEARLQRQVGQRRGVSDVDLELAVGHDPAVRGVIPVRQIVAAQNEPHGLRLARSEAYLLERFQLARRLAGDGRVAQIQLSHVRAGDLASVGDGGRHDHLGGRLAIAAATGRARIRSGVMDELAADAQVPELELGVGQAVAEREQRDLVVRVVVAVADVDPLGVVGLAVYAGELARARRGDLREALREGDGQMTTRIGFAEQHRGQRGAVALARIPGVEHRADLTEPGHRDRRSRIDDDDGMRVGGGHGRDQLVLR